MSDDASLQSVTSTERQARANAVVQEIIRRRGAGEHVTDASVLAANPDLRPELSHALGEAAAVRQAMLLARRAGTVTGAIAVLEYEQLDAPLPSSASGSQPASAFAAPESLSATTSPSHPKRACAIDGYVVLDEIGQGGQATVFRALQECTGRTVAIKVMLGAGLAGSRHRARFDREVALLASLDHPNIVSVIDRGCAADGSHFYVMPHIDGVPLDTFVDRTGWRHAGSVRQIVELIAEVARAVEVAHARGIVHRDLKPSNILVDRDGRPHVLDFGLARAATHDRQAARSVDTAVTQTGQVVGSIHWMSPEHLCGAPDRVDLRSDVYALGLLAYQSLTGHLPYPSNAPITDLLRHISDTAPEPPSRAMRRQSIVSSLSPPLSRVDAVVLRALSKRASDRQAGAGRFAEELNQCCRGDGSETRLPESRLTRFCTRRNFLRGITVSAAVTSAVAASSGWWWRRKERLPLAEKLPEIGNRFGMRLVRVGPRTVMLGSPPSEDGRGPDEHLLDVTLTRPFYIGVTEVTQGQYRAVTGAGPSDPASRGDDLPVQCVSWDDAVDFCVRLSRADGHAYRLPTEAEWECACRAGTRGAYATAGPVDDIGWYRENSDGRLHPVARKAPNRWGLVDMHGGVADWCADTYVHWRGVTAPRSDQGHVASSDGVAVADQKVVRGGDFLTPAAGCRSASRDQRDRRCRSRTIGFRVVLDPEVVPQT